MVFKSLFVRILFVGIFFPAVYAVDIENPDSTVSPIVEEDVDCKFPWEFGMRVRTIANSQIWASTFRDQRLPYYARLFHDRGWSALINDFHQYLGVDLLDTKVVTHLQMQGLRGSGQFVTNLYVEFSNDNTTWTAVKDENGESKLFDGNANDDSVVTIQFDFPVFARYVRVNPQRWQKHISLRIELLGCQYHVWQASFDGEPTTYLRYNVSGANQFIQSPQDKIKLRFRAQNKFGVLLYANSNQGDYLGLMMWEGALHLLINLGRNASNQEHLVAGTLLDDNQWHDVVISRVERQVNLTVDRFTLSRTMQDDFKNLDVDQFVFVGGVDTFNHPGIFVQYNFAGCIDYFLFHGMSLLRDAQFHFNYFSSGRTGAIVLPGSTPDRILEVASLSPDDVYRFDKSGKVSFSCADIPSVPISFNSYDSYLEVPYGSKSVLVDFQFRTYNRPGLLLIFQFAGGTGTFALRLNQLGHIEYAITVTVTRQPPNSEEIFKVKRLITSDMQNYENLRIFEQGSYANGLWHDVHLLIDGAKLNITVNSLVMATDINLDGFSGTDKLYLGGAPYSLTSEPGFLGCVQKFRKENKAIDFNNLVASNIINNGAVNGTCQLRDRCSPNPCVHNGVCSQTFDQFYCNCTGTGYVGAVCRISDYPLSCLDYKDRDQTAQGQIRITVDLDGSGPLEPFPVRCLFDADGTVTMTALDHDAPPNTLVDGYPGPGSYKRNINYGVRRDNIMRLLARSMRCEQAISWQCSNARLLSVPVGQSTEQGPAEAWGWWVGGDGQSHYYWGGSTPDSHKCACGLSMNCQNQNKFCNCDGMANDDPNTIVNAVVDSGTLDVKDQLPVTQLRFGDTGTTQDQKKGYYTLGPLTCTGDTLLDNAATFRKPDSNIFFPPLPPTVILDIYLQFRTTAQSGTFIHNEGDNDFIEIKLFSPTVVQYRFNVGNGVQLLEIISSNPLNDDRWHIIQVERNRKEALFKLDGLQPVTVLEPQMAGFRPLMLKKELSVGSQTDYSQGFVGCIRALMVNGVMYDLRKRARETPYGVSEGCVRTCDSNPCLNGGQCLEGYGFYTCDCTWTPFRGKICGREIGVYMNNDMRVEYRIPPESGILNSVDETIQIGFSTEEKQGILMQVWGTGPKGREYITIELNNLGGVRVAMDTGFFRQEVNSFDQINLANGQNHNVWVNRSNAGKTVRIQVDDYPITSYDFPGVDKQTDLVIDNITIIYMGSNGSLTQATGDNRGLYGFKGCLFRARFQLLFPLRSLLYDPRPPNVKMMPPTAYWREVSCSIDELNYPPIPDEYRVFKPDLSNLEQVAIAERTPVGAILGAYYREVNCGIEEAVIPEGPDEYRRYPDPVLPPPPSQVFSNQVVAILLGIFAGIFLLLAIVLFLVCRYSVQDGATYITKEDEGADQFPTADLAIAGGATGQPDVPKAREFFL